MMAKGGQFERDVAKKISLWFSYGDRDDMFWRTPCSGGRATVRGRKGSKTEGGYGDISATVPESMHFINVCPIECKRGYKGACIWDIFDRPKVKQQFDKFIDQIEGDAAKAGAKWWLLITRRDRALEMVTFPEALKKDLYEAFGDLPIPYLKAYVSHSKIYWTMPFDSFLEWVDPEFFKEKK